jgi:hypothetical protein
MVNGLFMVLRLVIRYITAMQTMPHITQALTPPSPYYASPAVTPVLISAQSSFIWVQWYYNGPVIVHMGPVVL